MTRLPLLSLTPRSYHIYVVVVVVVILPSHFWLAYCRLFNIPLLYCSFFLRVGGATATALHLLRVKESLTVPTASAALSSNASLEYEGDNAEEDSDGQKDVDTDDSPRTGHADPGSKGANTVGIGAGLMKKKPKRPKRH